MQNLQENLLQKSQTKFKNKSYYLNYNYIPTNMLSKNKVKPVYNNNKTHLNTTQQFELQTIHDKYFKQLQGECRITSLEFLSFHYLKAIILMIPVIFSIIGLFFLRQSKAFRVKVLYKRQENIQNATYLYIKGNQGEYEEIEQIIKQNSSNHHQIAFHFKKLKYFLRGINPYPIGLNYREKYKIYFNKKHIENGLEKSSQIYNKKQYGKNQHLIDLPQYFSYLFDILTKPFFIVQYIICITLILQRLTGFSILLFGTSVLTTSINYILLLSNYKRTKEIAQQTYKINVIREGKVQEIFSDEILPADVIVLEKNIIVPCDCVLVTGTAYINQASLTGESVPVSKYKIQNEYQLNDSNKWLYEGTLVMDCHQNSKMMAINTGYTSRKGRIIRKMVNNSPKQPELLTSSIYFMLQTLIIGIILFVVHLPILLRAEIPQYFKIYRFFDFVGASCPPAIPIYFNICYSFAISRLKAKNIYGTQPDKTILGNDLKVVCFDKTGTLTENQIQMKNVIWLDQKKYEIIEAEKVKEIGLLASNQNKNIAKEVSDKLKIFQIMSTCHSVKIINQQILGDEIDVKMFESTQSILVPSNNQSDFAFKIVNQTYKIDVLKINEFQSKLQHMSTLVYNQTTRTYSLFVKGAPQKIYNCSGQNSEYFEDLLRNLSFQGLRTIGIAYKQLTEDQTTQFLQNQLPKNIFQHPISKYLQLVSLVTFENKLKPDTVQTISMLNQCEIQTKIITGDNIYIAIETAFRAGMIIDQIVQQGKQNNQKTQKNKIQVLVLEGKDNQASNIIYNVNPETKQKNKYSCKILHFSKQFGGKFALDFQDECQLNKIDIFSSSSPYEMIAVDNQFFELEKNNIQNFQKIKIFARITPQNKAQIIHKLKKNIQKLHDEQSIIYRLLNFKQKIAMVGDGANDLMALKQADIGFGMNNTDASYAASFTISDLKSIEYVIQEAKNTSLNCLQCLRYLGIIAFLRLVCMILTMLEATYFSGVQMAYFNFTSLIWIPMANTASKPNEQMRTSYKPIINPLSFLNQLIFFGNVVILSLSLFLGYFFFVTRDQFAPNPVPKATMKGFYTLCHTNTIVFLLVQLPYCMVGFLMYNLGWKKFKAPIYKNYVLSFLLVGNFSADIWLFFSTNTQNNFLRLLPISSQNAVVLLLISLFFIFVCYLYNLWLSMFNYKENVKQKVDKIDQKDEKIIDLSNLNLNQTLETSLQR